MLRQGKGVNVLDLGIMYIAIKRPVKGDNTLTLGKTCRIKGNKLRLMEAGLRKSAFACSEIRINIL